MYCTTLNLYSVILLSGEYAEGDSLTVYMLRRGIVDPTDYDTLQVTSALRYSDRLGLWIVLSRGVHMRILPEIPGRTARVSPLDCFNIRRTRDQGKPSRQEKGMLQGAATAYGLRALRLLAQYSESQ